MSTHWGSPETAERKRKTLEYLLLRGAAGASRLEIRELTSAEAVNSDIDELRSYIRARWPHPDDTEYHKITPRWDWPQAMLDEWFRATGAPYVIPTARPDGRNERGNMLYTYFAIRRPPYLDIHVEPNGQLNMLVHT